MSDAEMKTHNSVKEFWSTATQNNKDNFWNGITTTSRLSITIIIMIIFALLVCIVSMLLIIETFKNPKNLQIKKKSEVN